MMYTRNAQPLQFVQQRELSLGPKSSFLSLCDRPQLLSASFMKNCSLIQQSSACVAEPCETTHNNNVHSHPFCGVAGCIVVCCCEVPKRMFLSCP